MARTAVTPTVLVVNGTGTADPTATATTAGAANGISIAAALSHPEQIILRVSNASGGSGTVSVKAGSQPSAIASGQGDITATVATGAVSWLGPFESARVGQADGGMFVDTSVVMSISAFKVNRH